MGAFRQGARPPGDAMALARAGVKFGIVGALGVVVNTAMLMVLYRGAHLPLFPSSLLAVEVSIIGNYLLNDYWTFEQQHPSLRRFVKFNLATLTALVVTPSLVWLLVGFRMQLLLANLVAIGAGAALNFTASAFWVWRPAEGGAHAWSTSSSQGSSSSRSR